VLNNINELYKNIILDHNNNPNNFGILKNAHYVSCGYNPICGDKIIIFVNMNNNTIIDVKFKSDGCAISKASASMMTNHIYKNTIIQIKKIYTAFHAFLTQPNISKNDMQLLGKLTVFNGVKKFPIRIKCATLAWHTLNKALKKPMSENNICGQ